MKEYKYIEDYIHIKEFDHLVYDAWVVFSYSSVLALIELIKNGDYDDFIHVIGRTSAYFLRDVFSTILQWSRDNIPDSMMIKMDYFLESLDQLQVTYLEDTKAYEKMLKELDVEGLYILIKECAGEIEKKLEEIARKSETISEKNQRLLKHIAGGDNMPFVLVDDMTGVIFRSDGIYIAGKILENTLFYEYLKSLDKYSNLLYDIQQGIIHAESGLLEIIRKALFTYMDMLSDRYDMDELFKKMGEFFDFLEKLSRKRTSIDLPTLSAIASKYGLPGIHLLILANEEHIIKGLRKRMEIDVRHYCTRYSLDL